MSATTTNKVESLGMAWDVPADDRGWLHIMEGHPQQDNDYVSKCCGWFLDYTGTDERTRESKRVLANAYVTRANHINRVELHNMGTEWFATTTEAREWVEAKVRAFFGL